MQPTNREERRKAISLIAHHTAYQVFHRRMNLARKELNKRGEDGKPLPDSVDKIVDHLMNGNRALQGQKIEPRYSTITVGNNASKELTYVQL